MACMARRRTTIFLDADEQRAVREASKREGVSQAEVIRRGIRTVTAPYRRRPQKVTGWLKLSRKQVTALLRDDFADPDA